ncbi:AsmA family protein [Halomonas sp. E19]|uniref:AsmA family protein n=1 Tax=Halomonas sp. E19 TaxID=3397247 RepID=UPI0040336175
MPPTASARALTDVALTSPVRGDLARAELPGLTLVLDGSTFTGRMAYGFGGQALSFDLHGDRLNLDDYLPPPTSAGQSASRQRLGIGIAHAEEEATLVPEEWLTALALEGALEVERLRMSGLDFTQVAIALAGSDGRQRLERFTANFYGGELGASGALDLTRDPIHWQLAPRLSRVRLEPLLQALADDEGPARCAAA